MNYIITEEDLWQFIGEAEYKDRKDRLVWFTESRKPIKEITQGVVSIEKDTTVFIDGLSLEAFIDAEICQRIKKYNESIVKFYIQKESE